MNELNGKVKMIYEIHQKLNLNIGEMSNEIGVSKSKTTKMFSDLGEQKIIKEKLLPPWKKIGGTRLWDIEEIVKWNLNTEVKVAYNE